MKKPHGNSHENQELHHLYAIDDLENNDVFKYGISDDPIEEDGLSKRMRQQLDLYNLIAGCLRFVGRILKVNILGRKKAEEIEREYVEEYYKKYGRYPKGNREKQRKKQPK